MGALMSTLHADQQRLEVCAETIPGLLVQHFDAPAVRSTTELRLMADNAAQRELIAALQTRNSVLADSNAALSRRIAELTRDLRTLIGADATPQEGCRIVEVPIPGGKLLVEVEADGDGSEGIDLLNVFVGGKWIDVQDLHCATDLDRLRESVAGVLA